MYFNWTHSLEVGVEEIDSQHMGLVKLINELHEHVVEEKIGHAFAEVFAKMKKYTQDHFSAEEKLMAEINMPGQEQHIREHKKFVFFVGMLAASAATFNDETSGYALEFLKDWLDQHIKGIDMDIKQYMAPA